MIITKKITVDPSYLNKEIKSHIYNIIKDEFNDKCFKEYGYILSVNNLISYNVNTISNTNSKIIFTVTFNADTLNPKIGDIIKGTIFHVDKMCILMNISNKAKVIIPINMMNGYEYSEVDKCYIKNKKKYCIGDDITVKINNLRYASNKFDYIASLKE